MKAPDKIYFPEDGLPSYIDWDGSPIRTKQVEDSDVCYISKDALLEWANDVKQGLIVEMEKYGVPNEQRIFAFQEFIDKINSL